MKKLIKSLKFRLKQLKMELKQLKRGPQHLQPPHQEDDAHRFGHHGGRFGHQHHDGRFGHQHHDGRFGHQHHDGRFGHQHHDGRFFHKHNPGLRRFSRRPYDDQPKCGRTNKNGGGRRIARLVSHVTFGPGECILMPGEKFNKTWRLRNASDVEWPLKAQLQLVTSKNEFDAHHIDVNGGLQPNCERDITIPLIAPQRAGFFEAHFRMVDSSSGRKFGQRFPLLAEVVSSNPSWDPNLE